MQKQYGEYFINTTKSKPGIAISAYIAFLTINAEKSELPVALCSILLCFGFIINWVPEITSRPVIL